MANTSGTESTRRCTSRLYTANISASRVEKCRYKVPGPTPARLATSLSDVVPDSANASCATCRIWSRFRCASERRTWTRVLSAMVSYLAVPENSPVRWDSEKRRTLRYLQIRSHHAIHQARHDRSGRVASCD